LFSPHTTITIYAATGLTRLGRRWQTLFVAVIVVIEAAADLVLRAHYMMAFSLQSLPLYKSPTSANEFRRGSAHILRDA
jgi:hypothetical protein